ncbi:MAG: hypothetical protein SV775_06090 [Thermodesulfobacteriota bacterium]|nr:hypothetical protein [Thermodesulfobacteriota bacterium]
MEDYKKQLALTLAETEALFFDRDLILKDGRPTPYFVNMAMFKTGRLALEMGSFFAGMMISRDLVRDTDIIVGPSYKGSAIAMATVISLWKDHGQELFFDYDRKEAKTHGEATASGSMFVNGTFFDGCRIFIVDDVATSMTTKYELLEKIGAEERARGATCYVVGIGIGIDREQADPVYDEEGGIIPGRTGPNAIARFVFETGISVHSVAGIREVVEYLYQEKVPVMVHGKRRPLDRKTKAEFDEYISIYGVDGDIT